VRSIRWIGWATDNRKSHRVYGMAAFAATSTAQINGIARFLRPLRNRAESMGSLVLRARPTSTASNPEELRELRTRPTARTRFMIANDLFRMSLAEAARPINGARFFGIAFQCCRARRPLEPLNRLLCRRRCQKLKRMGFRRDAVPILSALGAVQLVKDPAKLETRVQLPPAERFKRAESAIKLDRYDVDDPDTWDTGFFCVIKIPAEFRRLIDSNKLVRKSICSLNKTRGAPLVF